LALGLATVGRVSALPKGASGRADQRRAQAAPPEPQASVRIEVLVLQGSTGPGGIAAGLENLPQLRRPPFSAYSQISVVSRTSQPLGPTPSTVPLPSGGHADITLSSRQPNGRFAVNVQVTMAGRTHNVQFAAAVNSPFFTVISHSADSALILGLIVR
jgi:hypothetical protein